MSFIFKTESTYFSEYLRLFQSYPRHQFIPKIIPNCQGQTPAKRAEIIIRSVMKPSPEQRAYEQRQRDVIWKITQLFFKHFYDIVDVKKSNSIATREFTNLIDEMHKTIAEATTTKSAQEKCTKDMLKLSNLVEYYLLDGRNISSRL